MAETEYERVAGFATERQANAAVQELLLKGLGAVVESTPPSIGAPGLSRGDQASGDRFRVMVVPTDRRRACEILGVASPDELPSELARAKANVPPMRYLVLAALVALVGIPLAAFYLTFKLSGG